MAEIVAAQDVVSRWLPVGTAPTDTARIEVLIEDLMDHARSVHPTLDARITAQSLRVSTVKRVISSAVIRIWKSAFDPRASFSETAGPYSQSGSFSSDTVKGILLTDEELAALAPARTSSAAAFKLDLAPRAGSSLKGWVEGEYGVYSTGGYFFSGGDCD